MEVNIITAQLRSQGPLGPEKEPGASLKARGDWTASPGVRRVDLVLTASESDVLALQQAHAPKRANQFRGVALRRVVRLSKSGGSAGKPPRAWLYSTSVHQLLRLMKKSHPWKTLLNSSKWWR